MQNKTILIKNLNWLKEKKNSIATRDTIPNRGLVIDSLLSSLRRLFFHYRGSGWNEVVCPWSIRLEWAQLQPNNLGCIIVFDCNMMVVDVAISQYEALLCKNHANWHIRLLLSPKNKKRLVSAAMLSCCITKYSTPCPGRHFSVHENRGITTAKKMIQVRGGFGK